MQKKKLDKKNEILRYFNFFYLKNKKIKIPIIKKIILCKLLWGVIKFVKYEIKIEKKFQIDQYNQSINFIFKTIIVCKFRGKN